MKSAAGRAATRSLALARLLVHAADAVQAVRAGESLTAALTRCPAPARPGTQALAFEALRRLGTAQALRARLAPRQPPPAVDALLLTGLALLAAGDDAPYSEHTLVDQAVTAAHDRNPASARFVNAVLRRFLREREALVERLQRDPTARYNHPLWWIDRLRADWPGDWQAILRAADRHPPMTLRVNARRIGAAAYIERLAAAGMATQPLADQPSWAPSAVMLAEPCPVGELPGFDEGLVSVQDAAAQRAAPLLVDGLAAGARVLDACAAPGGKTAHLLEAADIDLTALDRDAGRLVRVGETLRRLGLAARTLVADAAEPARWWDGRPFDAILLDAPCSASGIVRRHPDIRWLRRAADIDALTATQARLLESLWPLLRRGGRLLYCTCSVFKAEGVERIDVFLHGRSDAAWADRPGSPGYLLPLADNPGVVGPSLPSPDGFYYALLQKS